MGDEMDHQRKCGDCQLCCKLLPVPDVGKPASTRCNHQRHGKGCTIYATRPKSCRLWSCAWLEGDATDLPRPDRAHYVIDVLADYIELQDDKRGEKTKFPVAVIWVDPAYPKAHHDPKLLRYLDGLFDRGILGLVRFNSRDAVVMIPPRWSRQSQWIEKGSICVGEHAPADVAAALEECSA
jgi:hypothetical protein